MNKTEFLKMALEKLTAASNYIDTLGGVSKVYRMDIERLKAALEEKDEPVGYFSVNDYGNWEENESNNGTPLYTTPPSVAEPHKRKPLTDEEIDVIDEANWEEDHKVWGIHNFARAIEAALEAKDEPWEKFCDSHCVWTDHHPDCKLAKDEPVAWYHVENNKVFFTASPSDDLIGKYWTPLYTTPPQRIWVGLTNKQLLQACQMAEGGNYMVAFQRIQQWLMEKNT